MSVRSTRFLTLVLFIAFASSILRWHRLDTRPSSMDETRHMQLAVDYRNWLLNDVPLTDGWSHVYPPLYHFSIIPALSIGVPSETKVALTHIVYLLVLILGCFLLGRARKRPDWESVLAAVLCAGYCYVVYVSRRALIDFPLMAGVTLAIALLARTKGFSSLRDSLLWGVAAGAGLLIKAPFIFFLVGPVVWVYATSRHPQRTRHALIGLAVCCAIAAPWYFWQSAYFLAKGSGLAGERTGAGTDPRTLSGWLWYLRILRTQMGLGSLLFTGAGIILALTYRRKDADGAENGLLVMWFLSGYLILSLLMNKDPRHTLPLLPALAILAAQGWGEMVSGAGGAGAVSAVAAFLMLLNMTTYDRPLQEDWQHAPIIALINQLHDPSQPYLEVSILSHSQHFFARTLKWSAFIRGVALQTVSPGDSDASFTEDVIRRTGDQGGEAAVLDAQWQDLRPTTRAFQSLFSDRGHFVLPDQSTVTVYHRDAHPHFQIPGLTRAELERRIALALQHWVQGPLKVSIATTTAGLQEGRLDRIEATCNSCQIKGVHVSRIDVILEKPWLNLYRLWDENRLGLMGFESLTPSCELTAEDVQARLSDVKGLRQVTVQFADNKVRVQGRYQGLPVSATAEVVVVPSRYPHLDAILTTMSVGHIPLPGWLLGKAHRQSLILYPIPDFPGRILVDHVTIENGRLRISQSI